MSLVYRSFAAPGADARARVIEMRLLQGWRCELLCGARTERMTEGEAGSGSGQVVEAGGLGLFRTTKAECKTEGEAGMILFLERS